MRDLNRAMYLVLVAGMFTSSLLYLVGLGLFLLGQPSTLQATYTHYSSFTQFWQGLVGLNPTAILMLATVVLIATPIARVIVSTWIFAANRDRKFLLVTFTVLAVLIASIMLGYFGRFTPS